jgi:hypothetical protein
MNSFEQGLKELALMYKTAKTADARTLQFIKESYAATIESLFKHDMSAVSHKHKELLTAFALTGMERGLL